MHRQVPNAPIIGKEVMPDLIWINGETLPMSDARVSVEDRGFQFADGIYEVIRLYNGRPFATTLHLNRFQRSADGIQLKLPLTMDELAAQIQKFIATDAPRDGMIYIQATRGVGLRNHVFSPTLKPTLLFYTRSAPP